MRFNLKKPCKECPFHARGRKLRLRHAENILAYGGPFPCHKTVEYRSRYHWRDKGKGEACAGRILFEAAKNDRSRVVELAQRLGADIGSMVAPDDLYASDAELKAAQIP